MIKGALRGRITTLAHKMLLKYLIRVTIAGRPGTNINKKIDLTSKCPGSVIAAQGMEETINISASKSSIRRFVITEKAPTRAFSWLKAATTAFTFKIAARPL